ncbi:MAG: hypothetical protein RRZ84_02890 [Romboutsia sp.]
MSRLEKTIKGKNKNKKYKVIMKIVFIMLLIIICAMGILVVDVSAKNLLGEEIKIQKQIREINIYIEESLQNMRKMANNIVMKFNK